MGSIQGGKLKIYCEIQSLIVSLKFFSCSPISSMHILCSFGPLELPNDT